MAGAAVRLSWAEPADRDVSGSLVVRFPAAGADASPETGRSYKAGEALGRGVVVFAGRDTKASDSPPCTQQLYAAWARDGAGNWSAAAQTAKVAGLPGSALPAAPTGLTAAVDGAGIVLAWTPAAASVSTRVVRRRGVPPTSASDWETVFAGAGASARDLAPELSPLVTWHYAVFACNPCGDCEATGARTSVTPTLTQSLQAGGFVIYWRHATANTCQDRQNLGPASMPQIMDWWKSCDRDCTTALARQLDLPGYDEADAIGSAIRTRKIPFSSVVSSEYCRALETASRIAPNPPAETLKDITFFVYPELDPCKGLATLVATPPRAGTNVAVVAHVFLGCTDGIASGEAWLYRPDGKGGSTLVAKLKANEWAALP
ncbi:MAG: hypothetical protein EXR95_09715 [Gemmatimonadetes bacterium]|nr:hypothetical protein [Gemmatimonadota bacterium]